MLHELVEHWCAPGEGEVRLLVIRQDPDAKLRVLEYPDTPSLLRALRGGSYAPPLDHASVRWVDALGGGLAGTRRQSYTDSFWIHCARPEHLLLAHAFTPDSTLPALSCYEQILALDPSLAELATARMRAQGRICSGEPAADPLSSPRYPSRSWVGAQLAAAAAAAGAWNALSPGAREVAHGLAPEWQGSLDSLLEAASASLRS